MKKYFLFLVFLLNIVQFKAQDIPYICTTSMEEYNELNSPISVNSGEIWNEGSVYPIYFDFDFTIYGQTYSSLNVEAGGGVSFAGFGEKLLFVYHTPFGGYLLKDKGIEYSLSNIDYEIAGEEGEYVIKIQWKNAGFVQWYPESDTSDYVDFQIWIFQEDSHIELHFGSNQTDPGTYGYPGGTSDPNPGPSIKYYFDGCIYVLSYFSAANNPSYDYFDFCSPNYSFIDGTPSEGITYTITPNPDYVDIPEINPDGITVFPNPARGYVQIKGIENLSAIESVSLIGIQGNTLKEIQDFENNESKIDIDINYVPMGIYFLKISTDKQIIFKKLIKN